MINSDDLQFFSVIAAQGSLAATARALNVTPPSITQRLQIIERKLKLKLVDRHARKITLTAEGLFLAERAKAILCEIDDLHEVIYNQRDEVAGCLKVLAPLGFGRKYIAPLIAQFQKQHKNLSIELELSDNPDWSAAHSWDLMIYIGELRDSSLKLAVLATNKRFICAAPGYISKSNPLKTPNDLKQHQCIALRENAEDVTMWKFSQSVNTKGVLNKNKLKDKGLTKQESVRIVPTLASNDGNVTKQWALNGHGIITRSEWDVAKELKQGSLVQLLTNYELASVDIVALLGTEQRARSSRTTKFLALLKEEIGKKPWLLS